MVTKKICILLVYFYMGGGRLTDNNFFQKKFPLFMNSCRANSTIDFMVVTDLCEDGRDKNIRYIHMELDDLIERINTIPGGPYTIQNPYKICDFRPAWGYVFHDLLEDYDFWGFCDNDLIFGDIRSIFTDMILQKYDVLGRLGHFQLFRNNCDINTLFMKKSQRGLYYVEAFKEEKVLQFDEGRGMSHILNENNVKWYYDDSVIADISPLTEKFVEFNISYNAILQTYYCDGKAVFRWKMPKTIFEKKQNLLYVHMQKRKLEILCNDEDKFIINYRICPLSEPLEYKDCFVLRDLMIQLVKTLKYNIYFKWFTKNIMKIFK